MWTILSVLRVLRTFWRNLRKLALIPCPPKICKCSPLLSKLYSSWNWKEVLWLLSSLLVSKYSYNQNNNVKHAKWYIDTKEGYYFNFTICINKTYLHSRYGQNKTIDLKHNFIRSLETIFLLKTTTAPYKILQLLQKL